MVDGDEAVARTEGVLDARTEVERERHKEKVVVVGLGKQMERATSSTGKRQTREEGTPTSSRKRQKRRGSDSDIFAHLHPLQDYLKEGLDGTSRFNTVPFSIVTEWIQPSFVESSLSRSVVYFFQY